MYVFVAFGISLHNGYSLVTSGRKHFVEYRGIEVVIITILFCTSLHFPLFSFLQGGEKEARIFLDLSWRGEAEGTTQITVNKKTTSKSLVFSVLSK